MKNKSHPLSYSYFQDKEKIMPQKHQAIYAKKDFKILNMVFFHAIHIFYTGTAQFFQHINMNTRKQGAWKRWWTKQDTTLKEEKQKSLGLVKQAFKLNLLRLRSLASLLQPWAAKGKFAKQVFGYIYSVVFTKWYFVE